MPNAVYVRRTVLFGDCDPAGVMYTPRFSHFAMEAIFTALDQWLGAPGLRNLMAEIAPPVRAMSFEFLKPITWDDELNMKVTVAALREHSFAFLVEGFMGDGTLAFTANISHVCISPDTREVVPIPELVRRHLS
tara:strand:- start:3853 stop:4254 length:402 start_codon:yes stop_codon:yes gene_type:complete